MCNEITEEIKLILHVRKLRRRRWNYLSKFTNSNWFLKPVPLIIEQRFQNDLVNLEYPVDVKNRIYYFENLF